MVISTELHGNSEQTTVLKHNTHTAELDLTLCPRKVDISAS